MKRTHDAPVILLVEYYASGGTRTYLKQLLKFFGELDQEVVRVACHEKPDEEIASLLERVGSRFVNYWSLVSDSQNPSNFTLQPNVWSLSQHHYAQRFSPERWNSEMRDLHDQVMSPGRPR